MSIQVNVNPLVLSERKEYKGVATIDDKEYEFYLSLWSEDNKKNISVMVDEKHYNELAVGNEWGIDALEAIEKRIEENIVYNDVW